MFNKSVWTQILITCFFKKFCTDQKHSFKTVESYILILKTYKNHGMWRCWEKKKKPEEVSFVMFFRSCNKWKSLWGFLASSSHSFCLWDLFLISDLFSVICVCWVPLLSWILLLKRLTGVLKLARNLQFEIGYGFFF